MEETLRVKIVADVSQANSSLKQVNNQTGQLSSNSNAATAALNGINRALNSVGLQTVKVNALVNTTKQLKGVFLSAGASARAFSASLAASFTQPLKNIGLLRQKYKSISDAQQSMMTMKLVDRNSYNLINGFALSLDKVYQKSKQGILPSNNEVLALQTKFNAIAASGSKTFQKMFNNVDLTYLQNQLNLVAARTMTNNVKGVQQAAASMNMTVMAGFAGKNTPIKDFFSRITKSARQAALKITTTIGGAISRAFNGTVAGFFNKFLIGKNGAGIANTLLYRVAAGARKIKAIFQGIANVVVNIISMLGKLAAKIIKIVSIATAAIAVIGALIAVKLAFSVSKLGNEIDKSAQKVGMSTKTYQKWAYILERCGIEASQLQTAMSQLMRNTANNKDRFAALGINTDGLSQTEIFEKTIEALQKIEDRSERARQASQLFGRSYAELSPLLNINAAEVARLSYQYDLLGAVMDGRAVRASVNMRDAIQDLKAAFQGLKNTLAQALMPIITNIIIKLTVFIAKVNMVLQALFGVDLEYQSVAESSGYVTEQAQETVEAVQQLKTLISGFDELNIFPSQNQNGDLQGLIDELGDLDWGETPTFGEILPQWAIEELENFRDNILPGIVEKIQDIIDKIDVFKERLQDPTFSTDSPFGRFLNWLIDWNWDTLFGDVDFENPFSLESLFGEHLAHLIETGEWDWSTTGIGRFVESLKQELENIGKAFRGEIEGETLLEKAAFLIGAMVRTIKASDLFKKEWWQKKFKAIKDGWNNSKIGTFFNTAWTGIKDWFNETVKPFFTKNYWKNRFQKIKDGFNDLLIVKYFKSAWQVIKDWFNENVKPKFTKDYWKNKFQKIKDGWNNSTIGTFLNNEWNSIKKWWNEKIKPVFTKDWWKNKFQSIKTGFNNLLIVKFFKGAWQGVKDWWNESVKPKFTADYWKNKFTSIKTGFNNLLLVKFFKNGWQGVKDWFNEKVKPKFTADYWKTKFESIKTGFNNLGIVKFFKGAWTGVTDWFNETIKPKFTADYWKNKWTKIKEGLENTAIVQTISTKWAAIKKWFSDNISGIFTKEWWKNKWDKIKEGLANSPLVQGITTKWNTIKKWFTDNIAVIFTKDYWKNKWDVIRQGLAGIDLGAAAKAVINGLITVIENGVNRIIDNITGPIQLLLVALGVLDTDFHMPRLQIPRLAKGGVIDEATIALVGEYQGAKNNPEIVTPESKMREVFNESNDGLVNVLVQGFKQIIGAIEDNKTEVSLDGNQLLKSVSRANRQYKTITGSSMI